MPVSLEETVALGSAIGRQAAADFFAEQHHDLRAYGFASDALEDAEQVIRRIDARLGEGEGSKVAYAVRQGMALRLTRSIEDTARQGAEETITDLAALRGPTEVP